LTGNAEVDCPARLKLTLSDRAGNEKLVSQRLRLPAP
jgi:hypothetical protein